MCASLRNKWIVGAAAGILLLASTVAYNTFAGPQQTVLGGGGHRIRHVLLISIDGMHAVDFLNCSKGINGGEPYCPNLAELALTGVNYLNTSTSKPSDSFPGLMALVTGGSPRTYGAFYDVAYDRSLDPPALTTGNGVAGAPGLCTPYGVPTGTTTEFDEGIDIDQTQAQRGSADRRGRWDLLHRLPQAGARSRPGLRACLPLELRPHQHDFRGHPRGRRLHRLVRQAPCRILRFPAPATARTWTTTILPRSIRFR